MAYLESVGKGELDIPYCLNIYQLDGNSDLIVEINNFNCGKTNSTLRLYVYKEEYQNTFESLLFLKKVIEGKCGLGMEKFKNFAQQVSLKTQEGILDIQYDFKENKVVLTILGVNESEKVASVEIIIDSGKDVDDLVLIVKEDVFHCFAYIQNEIIRDNLGMK